MPKPVIPIAPVDVVALEIAFDAFLTDARKIGNKAAASRARVKSIEIKTLLKDFRARSIKPYGPNSKL